MMDKNSSLKYVIKEKKAFLFSNLDLSVLDQMLEMFESPYRENITPASVENLGSTLLRVDADVIFVQLQNEHKTVFEKIEIYKQTKDNCISVCILSKGSYEDTPVNQSTDVITDTITLEELKKKIYHSLKDIVQAKRSKRSDADKYKDAHERQVIYLCDSLRHFYTSIDNGDLSAELFEKLLSDLEIIQTILDEFMIRSKRIKPIFRELLEFIRTFDFQNTY